MSELIEEDVSKNYVGTNIEVGRKWVSALGSEVIVRAITSPGNNAPHKVYSSYQCGLSFNMTIDSFMRSFSPTKSNKAPKSNEQILSEYVASKPPEVQAEILGTGEPFTDIAKQRRLFIEKPLIRGTHPYSFRSGEWAVITDMVIVTSVSGTKRLNYMVMFDDGKVDYWPVCDESNYEIKAASEVSDK
nr:hypothetical protein [uncultured Psychrobacter sp.]